MKSAIVTDYVFGMKFYFVVCLNCGTTGNIKHTVMEVVEVLVPSTDVNPWCMMDSIVLAQQMCSRVW